MKFYRSFVRFLLVGQSWFLPDLDRLVPQAVHPVSAKRHFRWTRTNLAIQERLRLDLNAWNREVPAPTKSDGCNYVLLNPPPKMGLDLQ